MPLLRPWNKCPTKPVPPVDALRVDAFQLPHASPKVAAHRLHQQVIVVGHLVVGMDDPIEALANVPEHR